MGHNLAFLNPRARNLAQRSNWLTDANGLAAKITHKKPHPRTILGIRLPYSSRADEELMPEQQIVPE
jgi:hypothetical protein